MSLYRYEALSDGLIRVLTLLPGEFGEAIYVQLHQFNLADRLKHLGTAADPLPACEEDQFEAISYAWGSQTRSQRLGCVDGSYLQVTESLHQALQYLRYPSRERRLWADAVCINQDDLTERAAQVKVMADIFRQASCVLVWLGEARSTDTLAFAMLHASDNWDNSMLDDDDIPGNEEVLQEELERQPWCPCCNTPLLEADIDVHRGYAAVDELCHRKWFSRLWVYQEIACARAIEVHCGFHHRSWTSFEYYSDPSFNSTAPSDIEVVEMCRDTAPNDFDPTALLRLLVVLGEKDCQEDHDRIFAIRSIAGLESLESLEPDYTLPVLELCRRVAVECLRSDNLDFVHPGRFTLHMNQNATAGLPLPHISLLLALASSHSAEDKERRLEGRPSWVPAFHCLTELADSKYHEYSWHLGSEYLVSKEQPKGFDWTWKSKASSKGRLRIEFIAEKPKILRILGCRIGSVLEVLERSQSPFTFNFDEQDDNHPDYSSVKATYRAWMSRCYSFLRSYGLLVLKDFKELMYCNSTVTGFDTDIYELMMRDEPAPDNMEHVDTWLLREFLEDLAEDAHKKLRYYDPYRNLAAIRCCDGWVRFGWIPRSARVGDLASHLFACPRPFLLRRQDDNSFTLLGDAWVFGVPDDSSFRIPQSNEEWFSLS